MKIEEDHKVTSYRGPTCVALLPRVDPATVPTNSRSRLMSMKIEKYRKVDKLQRLALHDVWSLNCGGTTADTIEEYQKVKSYRGFIQAAILPHNLVM